jgi:hypothetical protein
MGTVYLADDRKLGIVVALKVPHPALLSEPTVLKRFYREARAAARLSHPNLCHVFDIGELSGVHYLTMPYVEGTPLSDCPPADARGAADLVRKLALAMAEAHRLGVVHRDLKPSNVLITPRGEPVITDFGAARVLDPGEEELTQPGVLLGTPAYMAPEQFSGVPGSIGPACDIYALGVILYKLLTGRVPFWEKDKEVLRRRIIREPPDRPTLWRPEIDARIEAICLKALAKRPEDRFAGMSQFAGSLADYLGSPPPVERPRPPVSRNALRFLFVGFGERVALPMPLDRLYLDVGNDLRPGVIDHHHLTAYGGSTTGLVLAHPEFIAASAVPERRADAPFTIVLHEKPDLDCLASACLAVAYLTRGAFPQGSEALGEYVDRVDEGSLGMNLANPFSLYAACLHLANRLMRRPWNSNHERWQEFVRAGLEVVGYAIGQVARAGTRLPDVDAFACPGLFDDGDRREVRDDAERYRRKLAEPRTHARRATLRLPGQFGGTVEVEALLARDVENADDPGRVVFFKDWARTDAGRCPNGRGFVALSVFLSEGPRQVRRCILSVKPDSEASLRGLGKLLDEAEAERRRGIFGVDDRAVDPATGLPRPARPGYDNADPWYDGRAHHYTIVDGPRCGTTLTADEIEALFLKFGAASGEQRL